MTKISVMGAAASGGAAVAVGLLAMSVSDVFLLRAGEPQNYGLQEVAGIAALLWLASALAVAAGELLMAVVRRASVPRWAPAAALAAFGATSGPC